jgi:hypothetical protein
MARNREVGAQRRDELAPEFSFLRRDLRLARIGRDSVLDWPSLVLQIERQVIARTLVLVLHHEDRLLDQSQESGVASPATTSLRDLYLVMRGHAPTGDHALPRINHGAEAAE